MPTPSQSPTLTAAQFNALDINKDGKVDYSEANRLYQGQGLTQAQLLAMDLNKDGVITLKEQQAWMAQQAAEIESALLQGELDLLYIAPERLIQPRCLNLLQRAQLALFAIDEAHSPG